MYIVFFVKQKTAYEVRISDWSSDVCSSDLAPTLRDELVQLAKLNSGSFNARGVRAVAERLSPRFEALGATAQWLELPVHRSSADNGALRERAIGPALRLRLRPDAPLTIFLGGHPYPVDPQDSEFPNAVLRQDTTLNETGV